VHILLPYSVSLFTAFRPRTDQEQRRLSKEYHQLPTPTACKNFVKDHATQYTQLSRLPYFSLVEQIVIDPMHNLFLGMFSILHACDCVLIPNRAGQDPLLSHLDPAQDPSRKPRARGVPYHARRCNDSSFFFSLLNVRF
jgi:hypothetical protein